MDVDSDQVQRQPDFITYFEASPNLFAWREPRPQQIERRRASLNDLLIFDILLSSGGIRQPDTLYPPSDLPSLQRLLDAIESSQYDALKKECLVYFLLKWHQDGRESLFQYERCIPPQFAALADAYWYLDSGINIPRAVSILSDARLNKDYVSKIIHALSLTPNPTPLILKYVRTAKPLLTEPVDIDVYTIALAESNLVQAWQFQRTFNEKDETRPRLVRKILEWCVSPKARPGPLTQLLALPFTPYEQSLLHAYALKPPETLPTSSLATIQDLICVRLIQSGKHADAIKMDQQFSSAPSTTHPKIQTRTQTLERKKMMQELYAALPQVERTLLDAELELFAQGTSMSASSSNTTTLSGSASGDVSLSQSWEIFGMPQPAVNGKAPAVASPFRDIHTPVLPISERSGGPRFGGSLLNNSALGGSVLPNNSTATPGPAQPPILPVSIQTPQLNGSGSGSNARKSFPLSGLTPINPTSRPRQSLGHTPTDFLMSGVGSSSTGPRFPQPPQLATSSAFSSAGSKPNAFYQPPPTNTNGVKRAFGDEDGIGSGSVSPDRAMPAAQDMNVVAEGNDSDQEGQGNKDGFAGEEGVAELGFSVFGNGGKRNVGAGRRVRRAGRAKAKAVRKVPPGAYLTDEEEDGRGEDVQDTWRPPSPPQPQGRQTRARSSTTNKTTTKSKTKMRAVKEQDLGRSLPGSLMDEDDGLEEEEEDDYVAPLRAPSPPMANKRPMRKARTSASSSDAGDEEGVPTRRRSSRLTASSAPSEPPPVGAGVETSKPKKSTRAGGGRKKR